MLDASPPLQYPGLPMAKYGKVPAEYGGGNRYRLIWAPSRMVVLTGRDKTMTVPMYTGPYAIEPVGDFWILEGWQLPIETKEQWNANPALLCTGPYPANGVYTRRETLACTPADANIEKLITWIEEGAKRGRRETFDACERNLVSAIKDKKDKRKALIDDAMRPFGMEAFVGFGGQRTTKTLANLKTREECGLPEEGVTKAVHGKRVIYEVPQEA